MNVTVEVSWDVPVYKWLCRTCNATRYFTKATDGLHNVMYPDPTIGYDPVNGYEYYYTSETVRFLKRDQGPKEGWELEYHHGELVYSSCPYYHENPDCMIFFNRALRPDFDWYMAGDGVTGGVGNPIMQNIFDPNVQQTYI